MKGELRYSKSGIIGFIIGYFIIGFVLFFWNSPTLIGKLLWANLGIIFAIVIGYIYHAQKNQ